jgi:YHS domain-containing protein
MSLGRSLSVAALVLGAASAFCGLGCRAKSSAPKVEHTSADTSWAPPDAWKDARGEVQCPVCGTEVSSAAATCGHESFDGKTYFFCCAECEHAFHDAPAKFADGRALKPADCGSPEADPSSGVCR